MKTTLLTVTKNDGTIQQWVRPEDPAELYMAAKLLVAEGNAKAFSIITLKSHAMADEL